MHKALTIARARTNPRAELIKQVLVALDAIASEGSESFGTAVLSARELRGVRAIDDAGVMPLFDALDQARIPTTASVHQIQVPGGPGPACCARSAPRTSGWWAR